MSASQIAARLAGALGLAVAVPATAAAATTTYAQMAPLSDYLAPNAQTEIALARSAAPPAISDRATVLVLTSQGYHIAERGTNGFTCLVERSWENAFDNAEFWNPKMRAPVCYNAPASHSVLQYTLFRTTLALEGLSKRAILERLQAAIARRELPVLEPGSMAYMMSKRQYLNDGAKTWYPHVMVYAPRINGGNGGESWGANRPGSPVVFDTSDRVVPEPWALFFVPVGKWSDTSPAPAW